MKKLLLAAVMGLLAASAWAERADSNKPITITYETFDADDVSQVKTFTGNVVLTRGTLVMRAEKAVLREDREGYQSVTLTAAPGKLATFRQKRDGGPDLWVEGQAERIEYDDRSELVKLFSRAQIRQLDRGTMSNEIDSAFISYDSRKEVFVVRNDASGVNKPGQGRGTLIIAPKKPRPPATPDAADKP
ncbi:lipopolysaccharide transport periplasmic protein LptA [Massilia glaciei]|uniref:Lipopolysaccharide export system protein LptA n=1 Tax=Massilia glaciei TaxID=1524097 RepID=A0A2U2I7T5_9BURK|nr:lipopolysaccharide transport periplasmic protein LptA [Massilia glaciei]PWF55769.1 lipopolysaccharide transport periplasmic protein LptA [Massilia glaciei]